MRITKNQYLAGFAAVVAALALVRCAFPDVANDRSGTGAAVAASMTENDAKTATTSDGTAVKDGGMLMADGAGMSWIGCTEFFTADGSQRKNRIYSVPRFSTAFPDSNNVQMESAQQHGVKAVNDRKDAETRKKELVYIGASPYYHVDPLRSSIPYLVPRAAVLLNDIGRTFYDSLQVKGVPLHQMIVTSVLRSREDIKKLRNHNGNATENSCHLYGTTFDICYNRYKTVQDPDGRERRKVRNDTLKWVLSEVLRDMREDGRCYIKYEVKQGCFHITVR